MTTFTSCVLCSHPNHAGLCSACDCVSMKDEKTVQMDRHVDIIGEKVDETTRAQDLLERVREEEDRTLKAHVAFDQGIKHPPNNPPAELIWMDEHGVFRTKNGEAWMKVRDMPPESASTLRVLEKLVKHIAIRDAIGQLSREFCKGCLHGNRKRCTLPEAIALIESYKVKV